MKGAGIAIDDRQKEAAGKPDDFEDYCETLEVNPTATFDTIRKIYRVLAQRIRSNGRHSMWSGRGRCRNGGEVLIRPRRAILSGPCRGNTWSFTDGGKHHITAKGVDYAESTGACQPPTAKNAGLLAATR